MRMSVAGDGLTEPNLYFAIGKMQTDPDSPPIKKATQMICTPKVRHFWGVYFYG